MIEGGNIRSSSREIWRLLTTGGRQGLDDQTVTGPLRNLLLLHQLCPEFPCLRDRIARCLQGG